MSCLPYSSHPLLPKPLQLINSIWKNSWEGSWLPALSLAPNKPHTTQMCNTYLLYRINCFLMVIIEHVFYEVVVKMNESQKSQKVFGKLYNMLYILIVVILILQVIIIPSIAGNQFSGTKNVFPLPPWISLTSSAARPKLTRQQKGTMNYLSEKMRQDSGKN